MKTDAKHLEPARVRKGQLATDSSAGMAGAFIAAHPRIKGLSIVMISTGPHPTWEHVSARIVKGKHAQQVRRTPNWKEMCWIKDLFWKEDEVVVQYHPAKAEYVNNHLFVLHLWRPVQVELPTPPQIYV